MRRKLLWVALLYFAEGMPFGLVLDNFPVYFRVHGVSLAAIGFLSLAAAAFALPPTGHKPQPPGEWARSLGAWLARPGALAVFLFVLLYKLGDMAMGPMVKPFWVDRGLSLGEIALISTTVGVAASVAGALVGGVVTSRA